MRQITIVGLGPGDPLQLTREAWEILSSATELWLRTARHPVMAGLPQTIELHSFDTFYENADTFAEVYQAIAERIVTLGQRESGVIYAVPGHPFVGESTVTRISKLAREAEVPLHIVSGLSFIEPSLNSLSLDALDGLQIWDALEMVSGDYPSLNPDLPALIAQVYNRAVASELKLLLMNQYPDEHRVALIDAAGTAAQTLVWLPLYEIDRQESTPLTSLYVPSLPSLSSFEGFQNTIAHLRSPEGCPWDREQTCESLRSNLLEETYEVLDAIDRQDMTALREELGDLLLQVVLQTQIAIEDGFFSMSEVIAGIDAKLKRRHPHVWGDVQVDDSAEVSTNWEIIKRQERQDNGGTERSLLDGIPQTLPALAQAHAYSGRAATLGLNWAEMDRMGRLFAALVADLDSPEKTENPQIFLGNLLFACINWARSLDLDSESALREMNVRFAQRVKQLEALAREKGLALDKLAPDALEKLWLSVVDSA